MTAQWRPLRYRESGDGPATYDALHEGVPGWLQWSVIEWVTKQFPELEMSLHPMLKEIERRLRYPLNWSWSDEAFKSLLNGARNDENLLLDLVDLLLSAQMAHGYGYPQDVDDLTTALEEGGSAWRIAEAGPAYCLERRLTPEAEALGAMASETPGNAGEYLRHAWHAAFGREPKPKEALDYSIKAMEAALIPVVIPQDSKATLGKIIKAIGDRPDKWKMRLEAKGSSESVTAFAGYLDIVWTSHQRHGLTDTGARLKHDPAEARDAATIAAQVVQLVDDGGFVSV